MEPAPSLTNTPLDLQITICIFLHPSDILALRKTCKALERATRQRIVWVAALQQVCLDNTLFLPSFPIIDMSNLELERAAMGPRKWIDLCGTLQKEDPTFSEMLHPRKIRTIEDGGDTHFFIVPGGRYLVTAGISLSIWDLGYVSNVDCKLVASVRLEGHCHIFMVQATPDGKGLVILISCRYLRHSFISDSFSIFEMYPQSEIPLITRIAHIDWFPFNEGEVHLLPDILIFHLFHRDRIVFKVVDYRTNYSKYFSVNVKDDFRLKIFVTKTAIIISCTEGMLIWAIPALSPPTQPSDFYHFICYNSTHVPPLFKIPFPDSIVRPTYEILRWMTVSSWYFGSLESVYFDMIYMDPMLQRFKIIIEPGLSDACLHVINLPEIISKDLMKSLEDFSVHDLDEYRICEDALVYSWNNHKTWGAYTGLTSAPFTKVLTRWDGRVKSLCPTSGRFACRAGNGEEERRKTVVVDLF